MPPFQSVLVPLPFPLINSIESASCVFPFRVMSFYLVTTGWIFPNSSCENSINQSINQSNIGERAAGGCHSESSENLSVQCGENGVGRRNSGSIAYRATSRPLA